MYIDLGLRLDTADNAVEAGIYRAWQRLSSGRLNPPKREGIEFPFHRGHRGGGTWMG